jgi:predicted nucleic acid-binding protein
MTTAVDTNIILDILIPDELFADSSKALLERHLAAGQLILCEVVFAELAAQFQAEAELKAFFAETGMRMVHSNEKSLCLAGTRWAAYTAKRGRTRLSCAGCGNTFEVVCPKCGMAYSKRLHVLADFLIGAHALTQADCIISRDLGVYKTYFGDLKVVISTSGPT